MIENQKGVWLTMLEIGCMQSQIDSIIYMQLTITNTGIG